MSTPTPQRAVQRVFDTVELLESILTHLSSRDLLFSQRATHAFHDTIQGSVILRRKLFLEPDWKLEDRLFHTHESSKRSVNRPGCKPENNRLLLRAFPGCYPTITLVIMSDSTGAQAGFDTSVRDAEATSKNKNKGKEQWSWDVSITFPAYGRPLIPEAVDYREASWRKMYLCQPPCSKLFLVRRWQRGSKPAIIREGGIKMGDFFEEATRPSPECDGRTWHSSYISSDQDWHFEGNIKCSSVEALSPETVRKTRISLLKEYANAQSLCGGSIGAWSNEWDPGHAWLIGRRWGDILISKVYGGYKG